MDIRINFRRLFLLFSLIIWFISPSLLQFFLVDVIDKFSLMFFMFFPAIFHSLLLFLLTIQIYGRYASISEFFRLLNAPILLFLSYLFISFVFLFLSPVNSQFDTIISYCYILAYGYVLLISYCFYCVIDYNKKLIMKNNRFFLINKDDVCKAAYYAAVIILIIFYISLLNLSESIIGRYEILLKPAGIGLITIVSICFICTFGLNIYRLIVLFLALTVLYLTFSRTAIISVTASSLFIIFIKNRKKYFLFLLLLLPIIITLFEYKELIFNYFADIFLFYDKYRGIDKLSNRIEIWLDFWSVFKKYPLTGIGFRISDDFFKISSHNAYLMSLVETGIVGTILLMLCIFLMMLNLLREYLKTNDNISLFYLGLMVGVIVFGLGERFLFNIGNVTSIMTFYALSYTGFLKNNKSESILKYYSGIKLAKNLSTE